MVLYQNSYNNLSYNNITIQYTIKMSVQKDMSPRNKKLFLISSLYKKQPHSCIEIAAPLSYRQRLMRIRQFQLDKIKNEISVLVENQMKQNQKNSLSLDFTRMDVEGHDIKIKNKGRNPNGRVHKRGSAVEDRSMQSINQQMMNLGDHLTAISKKIIIKQKGDGPILPKIDYRNKTNAKINKFDFGENKIQPWRYRNEDFKGFQP